jgi:hypothetical protein
MTVPEPLPTLVEDYLNGTLDEARMGELENLLRADPEARRYFVRCARLHTDLHLELRARQVSARVLDAIGEDVAHPALTLPLPPRAVGSNRTSRLRRVAAILAIAAGLLLAVALGQRLTRSGGDEAVAWLVNAQNCAWANGEPPGDLRAGTTVGIDRGLAELRFQCGARVVIEGPARFELLSNRSARLKMGKLTARIPPEAAGFEVLSPQGKVIDLGTEFGVSVSEAGATDVYVFEGRVEAYPTGVPSAAKVDLAQNQAARIAAGQVIVNPAKPGRFVRAIVPPPLVVPQSRKLAFDRAAAEGIRDSAGVGTGLTHRLPGTGDELRDNDENLRLDLGRGLLELRTTDSDLNTQYRLHRGEYLGLRLSDLGFTGAEDFEASVVFPAIPALEFIGQFGLYAGARSDRAIRGGLLKVRRDDAAQYTQFLVNNADGKDADLYKVGLLATGTDLRMTLRRVGGKYTLTVENLTSGGASTLAIRHPDYLDDERELYVGLFGADPRSNVGRTIVVREFQATVWAAAPPRPTADH